MSNWGPQINKQPGILLKIYCTLKSSVPAVLVFLLGAGLQKKRFRSLKSRESHVKVRGGGEQGLLMIVSVLSKFISSLP